MCSVFGRPLYPWAKFKRTHSAVLVFKNHTMQSHKKMTSTNNNNKLLNRTEAEVEQNLKIHNKSHHSMKSAEKFFGFTFGWRLTRVQNVKKKKEKHKTAQKHGENDYYCVAIWHRPHNIATKIE